jgi:hypothetical protein
MGERWEMEVLLVRDCAAPVPGLLVWPVSRRKCIGLFWCEKYREDLLYPVVLLLLTSHLDEIGTIWRNLGLWGLAVVGVSASPVVFVLAPEGVVPGVVAVGGEDLGVVQGVVAVGGEDPGVVREVVVLGVVFLGVAFVVSGLLLFSLC